MAKMDDSTAASIKARLDRPIVLIGMMGSGKSKLGRMLADALALDFTDSDDEIEKAAGCTIAEIFERYGEPFFRDREKKIVLRLLDSDDGIIATGGGAPLESETAEAIRAKAISIWIRADLHVLVERTRRNATRPLLQNGDPAEILAALLSEREPVYAKADIIVDSHGGSAAPVLSETLARLDDFLRDGRHRHAG